MKKNICHISTAHPAFDIRIFYKQCTSLKNAGYDVSLVIAHDKEETVDGIHIVPLPSRNDRAYRFFAKGWTAFFKAIKVKADIYHFHDPEFIPFGLLLKLFGKKVIYDVHENVPAQILSKEWIKPGLRKFVSASFNALEKFAIKFFNRVVVARPDIGEALNSKKVHVVRNMPVINFIDNIQPVDIEVHKPFVVYAGGLTNIRGIKEMIDAIGLLEGKVDMWIFGKWDSDSYKEECMKSNGWKYTKDWGFKTQDEVYGYMKKAYIGIVNFLPVPNHITTQPNKPFEYMTCGLPMVMSNFDYWKELFGICSLFANPEDPKDIAEKIDYLLDNPQVARELGSKGRKYVLENYSWESEQNILINIYKELLG